MFGHYYISNPFFHFIVTIAPHLPDAPFPQFHSHSLSQPSMALRKSLTKRLLSGFKPSPPVTLEHSAIFSPYLQSSIVPPNAAKTNFHCEYLTSPEPPVRTSFHSRGVNHSASIMLPNFISIALGEKIREKLKGTNLLGDHARINSLLPPSPDHVSGCSPYGMTVDDARKLLRLSQGEKLKGKLRQIPKMSISYSEFLRICVESCGHEDQGTEFAKRLDESGHVIVLGNAVFLRPEQVAKTMETLISQSMGNSSDARARSEELEQMEKQKSEIDQKAQAQVRGELYCGLGFLLAQTAGFMRLTFWELSWDVMEPICFFVTSIHFALAYGFFLRTSTEPTFQGYFYRRFKTKQKRLMKAHNFDLEKYNELRKAFYSEQYSNKAVAKSEPFPSLDHSPDCTCGMYMHHHS